MQAPFVNSMTIRTADWADLLHATASRTAPLSDAGTIPSACAPRPTLSRSTATPRPRSTTRSAHDHHHRRGRQADGHDARRAGAPGGRADDQSRAASSTSTIAQGRLAASPRAAAPTRARPRWPTTRPGAGQLDRPAGRDDHLYLRRRPGVSRARLCRPGRRCSSLRRGRQPYQRHRRTGPSHKL